MGGKLSDNLLKSLTIECKFLFTNEVDGCIIKTVKETNTQKGGKMVNQKICDDVLRYGEILNDKEFKSEGDNIRQYIIKYNNVNYILTKCNGEWIYFNLA